METKVKPNQVWLNKKTGALLFIGKKSAGDRWHTTNSTNNKDHKVSTRDIQHYFTHVKRVDTVQVTEQVLDRFTDHPLVICYLTMVNPKTPWWLPERIATWIRSQLLEPESIVVQNPTIREDIL